MARKTKKFSDYHLFKILLVTLGLVLLTVVSIIKNGEWNVRHLYNLFYYGFFTFSFLSLNALIFSKEHHYFGDGVRRFCRVGIAVFYIIIYVVRNLTFMFTGQITRLQTVVFILGANKLYVGIGGLILIGLVVLVFVKFIHKRVVVKETTKGERRLLEFLFFFSLILFVVSILINIHFLKLENPMITDVDELVAYQVEDLVLGKELSRINQTYEGYNVVFVLLESVSKDRVGLYGYSRNVTPNIDSLAVDSIVFNHAYATSSHSDYAQPGLLSSRYILTNKLRTMFDQNIPRKFVWDVLKAEGYTTGYFSSQDDRWQGMDKYLNYSSLDNFSYSMTDGKTDYGSGLARKDYDHKTTDLLLSWLSGVSAEQALKQSLGEDGDPFFLYVNLQATHLPNAYPDEYKFFIPDSAFDSVNRYDNSLRYVDHQVGRIIEFLDMNDLRDNTIIVITADHGHDLENRHGINGHGFSIFDEEIVVPLIAYIPGARPIEVDDYVSHIDVMPSLVDLLGYDIPDEFQGDLMRKNRPIIAFTQNHKYMIGMIEGGVKTIVDLNRNLIDVYDLNVDSAELHSLDSRDYKDNVMKLLFWHHCQLDYYKHERWNLDSSNNRCMVSNNFKR